MNKMKNIVCAFVANHEKHKDTKTLQLTEMILEMQNQFKQNQDLTLIKQNHLETQIQNLNNKVEMIYKKWSKL